MKILCLDPVFTSTRLCSFSVFDSDYKFLYQQVLDIDSPGIDMYLSGYECICFDALRVMRMLGTDKFSFMLDAKVLYSLRGPKFDNLIDLGRDIFGENYTKNYDEVLEKIEAHLNSYRITKINVDKYTDDQIFPDYLLRSLYIERAKIVADLISGQHGDERIKNFYSELMYNNIRVLSDISRKPLNIDIGSIEDSDMYHLRAIKKNTTAGKSYLRFNAVGAKTGRLAFKKGTINIYALPKDLRKCITASPNSRIAQFDFKSFQPRLAIFSNKDEEFKKRFREVKDIYSVFPGDRDTNKIGFLAWMFSNSRNEMFEKEASAIYDFRNELYLEAKQNGSVMNFFGRVVHLEDKEKNVLFQNYITSLEVDAILELMRWINKILDKKQSRILFPFHDAIVMEIHNDETEIIPLLKKFMENIFSQRFSSVFPVEVSIGENFGNLKSEEINP